MLLLCVCIVFLLLLNEYVQPFFLASHDSNTAIIGAGVIGLCTAYQLARESHCTAHRVVVLDATDDVFTASSGTNTGQLSENEFKMALFPWDDNHTMNGKLWGVMKDLGERPKAKISSLFRSQASVMI